MVPLPPYARRVEYLEGTGTQWIDTGVRPADGLSFDLKAALMTSDTSATESRALFGARAQMSGSNGQCSWWTKNNFWFYGWGNNNPTGGQVQRNFVVGTPYSIHVDKSGITIDGVRQTTFTVQTAPTETSYPIYLYSINNGGELDARWASFRVYGFTIRNGSAPVRSFVPCRILDGGYLWDEVEGKFYGNQGTGDFVLGADVREGVVPTRLNPLGVGRRQEGLRKVEYLESTGTQYIDTGINYYADFEVSIRLRESVPNRALGINSNNCLQRINQQSPYWRFTGSGRNTDTTVPITERHTMAWLDTKVMADGATIATAVKGYASGGMQLFGASNTGYPNMIYWCRIYDSFGALVRDFVPVAIGSTGYLLDRVSGRLFGNQGTGDFVVGPDVVPRLRVWGNGTSSSLFDISTPYPLAAGNPVTGTVNGDARSGILDSNLYTVNDAGGNYVGEFIDMTPGGEGSPALRWFDLVAGSPFVGYCEIVQ